ncbi:hypothetical protein K239x_16660 [Planctomycetes bacterium K23_9]|uniref:Uncharacterized protein n=1 Tax=Stieleria marina TaxID=1930275 RepID=A0A517NRI4_9BACT|nr:hypothetical protein K239x_16660 [Planctomycetes bacterium K23_9]
MLYLDCVARVLENDAEITLVRFARRNAPRDVRCKTQNGELASPSRNVKTR